jgi:methylenetetrahydrofolate dehydrogenase (NADP+)/methenyltetrahydrofolate cyclohydrolase
MVLVDGRSLRDKILTRLTEEIRRKNLKPRLAIVLVGDDEASLRYIKQKQKASGQIGAETELVRLPNDTTQERLDKEILRLNNNKNTDGIIVQLPLPKHLDKEKSVAKISEVKDVDGFLKDSPYREAAAAGIIELLQEYKVQLVGKKAVVLGSSGLVGVPTVRLLRERGAEVIEIDVNTPGPLAPLVQKGDVVISAVGKINLVTADMVKEGAVVIDAGTNFDPKTGKLVGDVDFENVAKKASLITPVPGGVGPMTVAMLMENLVTAAKSQA